MKMKMTGERTKERKKGGKRGANTSRRNSVDATQPATRVQCVSGHKQHTDRIGTNERTNERTHVSTSEVKWIQMALVGYKVASDWKLERTCQERIGFIG